MMIGKKFPNIAELDELQHAIAEWRARSFPGKPNVMARVIGVMEELGELSSLVLKKSQGIRGAATDTEEQHLEKVKDAIGDLAVFLMGVADFHGLTLSECIGFAWDEVKDRDWIKFPINGVSE